MVQGEKRGSWKLVIGYLNGIIEKWLGFDNGDLCYLPKDFMERDLIYVIKTGKEMFGKYLTKFFDRMLN